MDGMKDLGAVIGLHNWLRTAERRVDMPIDDTREAYRRIDYRVTSLAGGRVMSVISGRELENTA